MKSVLIVSSNETATEYLKKMLCENYEYEVITCSDGNSARRMVINRDFDLAVINSPLKDEYGTKVARDIAEQNTTEVIFLVKSEISEETALKLEDYGIFTLTKPLKKEVFWNTLKMACIVRKKIMSFSSEKSLLKSKIEDIKVIDKAKCLLIERMNINEEKAHKHIEKTAMERRLTKREVADEILARFK